MKVSIVVLNYNGINLLKKFIPQLIKNSGGNDIYVIDNNSFDDSISFLETEFPEIKIIRNKDNYGYAGGYNNGLKQIDSDLFICLNNDATFLDNKSIENIIKIFKNNSDIIAAQPRIINYFNKDLYDYAGASGGFIDLFGYPFCRGRILNNLENSSSYQTTREIFWASGSCLVIRKKSFESVNGFDSSFFAHMEEIDLCWRLKNKNINNKIVVIGNSSVYHLGGGTLNNNSSFKYYLNFRNSIIMLIKNLPKRMLIVSLLGRLLIDLLILIFSILSLRFNVFFGLVKAYLYLTFNVFKVKRVKSNNEYYRFYYCKSILYNYFLRRKKIFSKI